MKCVKCGTEFDSKFCPNCGAEAPVTTEAPATTEAPETTEAPVKTEAPATTEAPTTTEATATTEAPAATEAPVLQRKKKSKLKLLLVLVAIIVIAFSFHHLRSGREKTPEVRPTDVECWTAAQMTVEDYLKSPKTAKYSYYDEDWEIVRTGKRVKISSFVDSQNSFGATVRSDFTVILTFAEDMSSFNINYVAIDGKVYRNDNPA